MSSTATQAPKVALLKVSDVHPDPDQPRKHFDPDELFALAESIKQHGLIQPITVRQNTKGYVIVAGERRWRAAKLAKQQNVAAIVTDADDDQAHTLGTIENVARADLNPIEEGDAYVRIGGDDPVVAKIAKLVSRPEHRVADRMRLARLPGPIRAAVIDGEITLDAARTLAGIAEQPGGDKIAVALAAGVKLNVFSTQRIAQDPARCLIDLGEFDPSEVENPCPGCTLTGPGADANPDQGTGEQIKDGKTWRAATFAEWQSEEGEYRNCTVCEGSGQVVEKVEGAEWPEHFAVTAGSTALSITDDAFAQLPTEAQAAIQEQMEAAEAHNAAMRAKHGHQWWEPVPRLRLDSDEIADAALAAGCATRIGTRVLVTDPAFVAEYLPQLYASQVATFLKKTGPRGGGSSSPSQRSLTGKTEAEQKEAAKQREKDKKARVAARQFNQDLGRAIQTKLGEVPVTTDAMKLLVRTILDHTRADDYNGRRGEGHALWQRFTRADWPTKKDGSPIIPRAGDERAKFCKQVDTAVDKELAAAKTPEQALGVLVRYLAHGLADLSGLPNADLDGSIPYRTEAKSWRAFVMARLPKPIRDRVPKSNGVSGRSYAWGDH